MNHSKLMEGFSLLPHPDGSILHPSKAEDRGGVEDSSLLLETWVTMFGPITGGRAKAKRLFI